MRENNNRFNVSYVNIFLTYLIFNSRVSQKKCNGNYTILTKIAIPAITTYQEFHFVDVFYKKMNCHAVYTYKQNTNFLWSVYDIRKIKKIAYREWKNNRTFLSISYKDISLKSYKPNDRYFSVNQNMVWISWQKTDFETTVQEDTIQIFCY